VCSLDYIVNIGTQGGAAGVLDPGFDPAQDRISADVMMDPRPEITPILRAISAGDRDAVEQLVPLVYDTLKRIAHRQLRRSNAPLSTTELVHEAFLKVVPAPSDWLSRGHFFGVVARAMRQTLIDIARRRRTAPSEPELRAVLGSADTEIALEDLIALGDALQRLGQLNPRLKTVVEYRYFAGLSEEEIAEVLQVSIRTVERDWVKARLWLHTELYPETGPPDVTS
jgi:RNA polymerase sigma factor (TIGR02999 family)